MNKLLKHALIVVGINIVIMILLVLASNYTNDMESGLFVIIVLPAIVLFLQLIVGIILAVRDSTRPWGQALLVGIGMFFLVGLSICGVMAMGGGF